MSTVCKFSIIIVEEFIHKCGQEWEMMSNGDACGILFYSILVYD